MTSAIAAEADVLRCGYDMGIFDKSDIERWAERQIEAIDEPSAALIDLAMIRHAHPLDVMNLLRTLGSPDPAVSIETRLGFIGLLFQLQRLSTQLAIRGLWSLLHEPGITNEQESAIYYLDAGFDLAVAGTYGTLDEIERKLRDFVLPYAQRLRSQYPHLIQSGE